MPPHSKDLYHLSNSVSPEGGPHSVRLHQFMGGFFNFVAAVLHGDQ